MKVTNDIIKKQVEKATGKSVMRIALVPPTRTAFVAVFNRDAGCTEVAVVDYATALRPENFKIRFITPDDGSSWAPIYMPRSFYMKVRHVLPEAYKVRIKNWFEAYRTLRSLGRGAVVEIKDYVGYTRLPKKKPFSIGGTIPAGTYLTVAKVALWYLYARYNGIGVRIFLPALYAAGFAVIKDAQNVDDNAIPIYRETDKGLQEGLYLALYNGADSPTAFNDVDDFGCNGPVIGPLRYVQTTYGSHIKFEFVNPSDAERYGFNHRTFAEIFVVNWQILPLALYNGKFYGDWITFYQKGDD